MTDQSKDNCVNVEQYILLKEHPPGCSFFIYPNRAERLFFIPFSEVVTLTES